MNGKQAKRTKKMCKYIWANIPQIQLTYQHDFKKFYRQAKSDVKAGTVLTLSQLYLKAVANEEAK